MTPQRAGSSHGDDQSYSLNGLRRGGGRKVSALKFRGRSAVRPIRLWGILYTDNMPCNTISLFMTHFCFVTVYFCIFFLFEFYIQIKRKSVNMS